MCCKLPLLPCGCFFFTWSGMEWTLILHYIQSMNKLFMCSFESIGLMFECICAHQNFYAEWFKSMYMHNLKGRNATSTGSPDKLGNLPWLFSKRSQCVERLVSFLTSSWHNQNRTRVFRTERQHFACALFNQLCVQRSVCMIFTPRQLYMYSKWPDTFALSPVLGLRVCPCAIKVFLPDLLLWGFSREKNTRLSLHA